MITLGGIYFHPRLGGADVLPIGALYWRHRWEKYNIRTTVSIVQNDLDLTRSFGELELLGHLENETVPSPTAEIVNGQEVKESSILWGTFSGWLGMGWRKPVAPFHIDNDLKLQAFYHAGYLYSNSTADTGPNVRLPPDTLVHGIQLRARYDSFSRNLMELPHAGWAGGDGSGIDEAQYVVGCQLRRFGFKRRQHQGLCEIFRLSVRCRRDTGAVRT